MTTIELTTPTASCGTCAARIEGAFEPVAGVESASLDLETKRTTVVYDPATIDPTAIVATLAGAGYPPEA
jgi:copper chaperone CopZ